MTVDVACLGAPFLDLIFRGLTGLPAPGDEQLARELVIVPGAMANVAYALGRLGLSAVVCAPIGDDPAGRLLQELMAAAGVRWMGRRGGTTPVSVALPFGGDRAFVTASPTAVLDTEPLAALEPRAIVIDLPNVDRLPSGPLVYAVVGDPEVRLLMGRLPSSLASLRALILNDREACLLTGVDDAEEAARRLAALGTTVVVTCSDAGALAIDLDGRSLRSGAPIVEVEDPTGAGDLFTAAWVWADLDRRALEERLELATTYATLSLVADTSRQKGMQKGIGRADFDRALVEETHTIRQ